MATIIGSAGSDTLLGTSGSDFIDTAGGFDAVNAGAGDDIVRLTSPVPDTNDPVKIIDGGSGHDVLDLTAWQGRLSDHDVGGFLGFNEPSADGSHLVWPGYVRNFEEVHLGPGVQWFSAYQASEADPATLAGWMIVGSAGADNVADSRGFDRLDMGAGNDAVHYMGGSDWVSLGDGDDIFSMETNTGFQDHVTINGGAGIDTLQVNQFSLGLHMRFDLAAGLGQVGESGFTLTGMENIRIETRGGPAETGRTVEIAGDDSDNNFSATGDVDTLLLGRAGNDALLGNELQHALIAYGGAGKDSLFGSDGSDWLNGGQYGADSVPSATADDGGDYIDGRNGNDHIFGNSQFAPQGGADGGDLIHGGDGLDYVNGNGGNDTIYGDAGPDRLYGGAGGDIIDGGTGNDHLNGNKGDDTLHGGEGDDDLMGGQGDDRLNGDNGFDRLTGNAGNDIFSIFAYGHFATSGPDAYRTDLITDFQDGGDKLELYSILPTVLHPGAAVDFAGAFSLAAKALYRASDATVAAVQVGSDTVLFYDNFGHGPESAIQLLHVDARMISTQDFVP